VRISVQAVLPPKRAVRSPGAAIDPRVPQNRTYTMPPQADA
jgi:hypothetical protein